MAWPGVSDVVRRSPGSIAPFDASAHAYTRPVSATGFEPSAIVPFCPISMPGFTPPAPLMMPATFLS